MTAVLEGGEWSASRPGRTLPTGKNGYPFYRRLGGPQGRSGRAENLVPTGIRSRTVQPVVSRYTDWATGPTIKPTRCTNSWNLFLEYNSAYFGQFLCPSSGVFHCTHSNTYRFADSLWAGSGRNVLILLYDIYHCCVYSDDGQRNCPNHVEFYSKNKFEK